MPNVDFTEMDLAVIECLYKTSLSSDIGVQPPTLVPCLQQKFPENDEVAMREGESITRLRGRQLLEVYADGRLTLTSLGIEMAEGLQLTRGEA
jgi:hypothetical protein